MRKMISPLCVTLVLLIGVIPAFSQTVFTGLIIDAQDLALFNPPASPKIIDEDGREVYGSAYADREWAIKQGIVGYAKSLAKAKANPRVSGNPLVIKAIRVTGANMGHLVLSNEDARKIRKLAEHLNFLSHAKVMIVVH
jgi:hypothetical protein